jgi:DNA-binding transcriptional LysR family regulator
MIDFKGLETFLWVAMLGSFNSAAQKLNTTQPAVSQRIAQLERDFGVKLLTRERRRIAPTAAGRKLLAYAERVIRIRTEMVGSLCDPSAIAGTLRLGVAETIVHTWLPKFIKRVTAIYPKLALEIESDITWEIRSRLLNQQLDLAFAMGPLSTSALQNRFLCSYPMGFIASPMLKLPRPATIRDIIGHRLVTFPRRTQPHRMLRTIFNEPFLPDMRLHSSNALTTIIRLAVEGVGIAVIPPEVVRAELEQGKLEIVRTDVILPDVSFTASWLSSPDALAAERLAHLAVETAQDGA